MSEQYYFEYTTIDTPLQERRKLHLGDIYKNRVQCLSCEDIIHSKNRHDYVTCKCNSISLDGGSWYVKVSWKPHRSYHTIKFLTEYYTEVEESINDDKE